MLTMLWSFYLVCVGANLVYIICFILLRSAARDMLRELGTRCQIIAYATAVASAVVGPLTLAGVVKHAIQRNHR